MQRNRERNWTYIGWLIASVLLSTALVVLFVFAAHQNQQQRCRGIVVEHIRSGSHPGFVSVADVLKTIRTYHPEGKPLHQIDLHTMEQALQQIPWMQHVVMFFDNQGKLHVRYAQRIPLLLVYTTDKKSFYLDKEGYRIRVSERYHPDVPIVTGWFSSNHQQDSVLAQRLAQIGISLLDHHFWNAQVQQIAIQPDGRMLMIPTVGPVIQLGNAERFSLQCKVLEAFYEQVLLKGYMQVYDTIDVSVPTQIMAIRKSMPMDTQMQQLQFADQNRDSGQRRVAMMPETNQKSVFLHHTQKPLMP
jgi:cell division protein FtsQ